MLQLKLLEIQRLQSLQDSLLAVLKEISKLKDMLTQLTTDQCSVAVSFSMVNNTRKDEAIPKREAEEFLMYPIERAWKEYFNQRSHSFKGGIMEYLQPVTDQIKNRQAVEFCFSEADAIVLLNLILQRKAEERKTIVAEMKSITKNAMHTLLYLDEQNPVRGL